jgi:hypothetical protein
VCTYRRKYGGALFPYICSFYIHDLPMNREKFLNKTTAGTFSVRTLLTGRVYEGTDGIQKFSGGLL